MRGKSPPNRIFEAKQSAPLAVRSTSGARHRWQTQFVIGLSPCARKGFLSDSGYCTPSAVTSGLVSQPLVIWSMVNAAVSSISCARARSSELALSSISVCPVT
jgi:hypothetical protein